MYKHIRVCHLYFCTALIMVQVAKVWWFQLYWLLVAGLCCIFIVAGGFRRAYRRAKLRRAARC